MKLENQEKNNMLSNIRLSVVKIIIFVLGLFILAFGAAALIKANLGVASWDVLHIGLAKRSFLSIGAWVQIIGIFMILLASALERKQPQIGSAINIILIGFFLNWILDSNIFPIVDTLWKSILLLACGVGLMGLGSGMYVATALGAGPRDGMTLILAKMSGKSVRLVRTGLEVTALFCGWLVGGPISIGTFIVVFLVGPIMQASLFFWRHQIEDFENLLIEKVVEEPIN
ncbi:YitT family protein [Pelosinus sp. sgz500959]|uniref:YczE/YyaS/YitT family protein n=1 Tax=Pelosinus sp. sgz500959 TaxID=3242472 RepID=UPI003671B3CC